MPRCSNDGEIPAGTGINHYDWVWLANFSHLRIASQAIQGFLDKDFGKETGRRWEKILNNKKKNSFDYVMTEMPRQLWS